MFNISKGNGRRNNNGMDKNNGTCNGVSSNTPQDLSNQYSNQGIPNSGDRKAGIENYQNQLGSNDKEFKNKIK